MSDLPWQNWSFLDPIGSVRMFYDGTVWILTRPLLGPKTDDWLLWMNALERVSYPSREGPPSQKRIIYVRTIQCVYVHTRQAWLSSRSCQFEDDPSGYSLAVVAKNAFRSRGPSKGPDYWLACHLMAFFHTDHDHGDALVLGWVVYALVNSSSSCRISFTRAHIFELILLEFDSMEKCLNLDMSAALFTDSSRAKANTFLTVPYFLDVLKKCNPRTQICCFTVYKSRPGPLSNYCTRDAIVSRKKSITHWIKIKQVTQNLAVGLLIGKYVGEIGLTF